MVADREYDADNPGYAEEDEPTMEMDPFDDPEAQLLQREEGGYAGDDEATEEESDGLNLLNRLDELLVDFSDAERRLFWLVFVDGLSIAAAGREAGVGGDVHGKFKKMLAAVKHVVGDGMPGGMA